MSLNSWRDIDSNEVNNVWKNIKKHGVISSKKKQKKNKCVKGLVTRGNKNKD